MDTIELSLFVSRLEAVCEEMGVVLRRTAFSPNIKDRLDFSCALFDPLGQLCAQAAHIPVHLGSMAFAMADIVNRVHWQAGDVLVLNDPYLGGTHLPDVTVIAPVFHGDSLAGFVVNRAHHADIGADSPGSMPTSVSLEQEGILIAPAHLRRGGRLNQELWRQLTCFHGADGNVPAELEGDLAAQVSALEIGVRRVKALIGDMGLEAYASGLRATNDYAERLAAEALSHIPDGCYGFSDCLDDDGAGTRDIPIQVSVRVKSAEVWVDFAGTSPQVKGNVNCPLAVAAAAVFYVFRCLMPAHAPACAGSFRRIHLLAEPGTLVNAHRPAAVAAGNVETSSRIVDVVLGALAQALPDSIPAASQGGMNNVAMGWRGPQGRWDYYETLGGGMGGGPGLAGGSAVHSHMTNTLNTPVESLEMHYPLRVLRYGIRRGSGGAGRHAGGDGLVREYGFLGPAEVTLLTERRSHAPWGLAGGKPGLAGENRLNDQPLPPKTSFQAKPGDRLLLATPGGGGWGRPTQD